MLFRHTGTGNCYKLIDIGIRESDLCPVALYREIDHFSEVGPIWVRLVDEFFDGRFEPYAES